MLLSTAKQEYLQYRRSERYKPNTVGADRVALNRMIEVMGDREVASITPKLIDGVYEEMAVRQLRASTVNLATACMRSFFKWATDRGHYSGPSPVSGRRYRPREARELTRVPIDKFPALLDAARTPRDRMLLALGLYTMARSKEITGIRIKDVDLSSSYIQIYVSKSNLFDQRPISLELRNELTQWLKVYADEVGPLEPDYFLVPAVRGGNRPSGDWPLLPRKQMVVPEDVVHRALRVLGIDDSYHSGMHVLRRSSARATFDELANSGYDGALRMVKEWLNHSSTAQTEVYLGLALDKVNRDKIAKDKPMFPSLAGDNVIRGDFHGEDRAAGM